MFEDIKNFFSDTYNDMIINFYDSRHFEPSNFSDTVYDSEYAKGILLSDCWGNGKGGFWCWSDERLKENISDFNLDCLNWINNIKLKIFNYKGHSKKFVGVIAQELQKVHSDSVQKGQNGFLYVDLSQILFMTVATVKQLNNNINNLRNENKQLKNEIQNLIKRPNKISR